MSNEQSHLSGVFRIDVSAEGQPTQAGVPVDANLVVIALLRQMLQSQEKQNQLLEQLVQQNMQAQKQRTSELQQWKDANPRLAKSCRRAAETLSRVQTEFLQTLTLEVEDNEDALMDGDFMLSEFVDRFGPRLAHLNGVLQVLAQLSAGNATP
jgi:exonuclease VII large subunit